MKSSPTCAKYFKFVNAMNSMIEKDKELNNIQIAKANTTQEDY